jgi:formamidopyrimidine-DNA glycosylase
VVRSFAPLAVLPVGSNAWAGLPPVLVAEPSESSTAPCSLQSGAVPELPDLTIVSEAFHAALAGRPITLVEAPGPLAVRGTPAEQAALVGQLVVAFRRRGKFMLLDLERDRVVFNPMLTGRFQLALPKVKRPQKTAFVLGFGTRDGGIPEDTAPWTAGAPWIPADDATPEVRYRDPTQMGKVYLLPTGVARDIPGGAPEDFGPEADDPALSLDAWRMRIKRHPGELKNLLKNQEFVAGIGNAYSDEILHEAGFLPFRKRSTLSAAEVDALYDAMRLVLPRSIAVLR